MNDYRILVVDDEEDLCEILKFNLEMEGYTVDTAYSAEEALKLNVEFALAACVQQLLVQPLRVVQKNFIPAREKKRRRQVLEVAKKRRAERIFGVLRIAGRIKVQKLFRERRVVVAVLVECRARLRQIRPRRNGDDPARERQLQLLEP